MTGWGNGRWHAPTTSRPRCCVRTTKRCDRTGVILSAWAFAKKESREWGRNCRSSPSVCLHDFFAQSRWHAFQRAIHRATVIANDARNHTDIDFWEHHRNSCIPCTQRKPAPRAGAASFTIQGQGGAGAGAGRIRRAQPYPQPKRAAGPRGVHHLCPSRAYIQKRAKA